MEKSDLEIQGAPLEILQGQFSLYGQILLHYLGKKTQKRFTEFQNEKI